MSAVDYSVKGTNQRRNSGGVKMETGIHEKCQFLPVTVNEENQYIEFKWENPALKQINKRIYFPDHTNYKPTPRQNETQDEANQRDIDERIEHMRDYLYLCYTPAEVDELNAKSFLGFCQTVAKMLNDKREQFYVNLKIIPTSDLQYTELPRFAGGYIELWREGLKPTLKFNDWELENRINPLNEPGPSTDDAVVPGPNLFNQ